MQALPVSKKNRWPQAVAVFASDIKLSHSIFALPFVGVALTITGIAGVTAFQWIKILGCMVFARSFAMGMNRYLDRGIDALNSRTKVRALPSGLVDPRLYLAITITCGMAFVAMSFGLSKLAGFLSPVLLVVLAFYSIMKKLSWMTHWYLGICLGLAPVAAEIALFGRITLPVALVGFAVAAWTAGFDLLYSLQDKEFDKEQGLHSVPSRLGHKAAIWLSRASFIVMICALILSGELAHVGPIWYVGVMVVACILAFEHWTIREAMVTGTSSKINLAFFNLNALVSVMFFLFSALDVYVKS